MDHRITSLGCLLWLGCAAAHGGPRILERDAQVIEHVPLEALQGPGAWENDGWFIATGQSIRMEALGESKGLRTAGEIAAEDAKLRLLRMAAAARDAEFDPETYVVEGDVKGMRTAAKYTLDPFEGIFLVALVKREDVRVKAAYSPELAGKRARSLFNARDWMGSAKVFAALTAHGVGDADTLEWARAAGAQVNLEAGVTGPARTGALRVLGEFYEKRGRWEDALKHYHSLYLDQDAPERAFLEKLEKLAELTRRPNNAEAFRKEIERRWSRTAAPGAP